MSPSVEVYTGIIGTYMYLDGVKVSYEQALPAEYRPCGCFIARSPAIRTSATTHRLQGDDALSARLDERKRPKLSTIGSTTAERKAGGCYVVAEHVTYAKRAKHLFVVVESVSFLLQPVSSIRHWIHVMVFWR